MKQQFKNIRQLTEEFENAVHLSKDDPSEHYRALFLFSQGAILNKDCSDRTIYTAPILISCILDNNLSSFHTFLKLGADPLLKDSKDGTILHALCYGTVPEEEAIPIAKMCIKLGVDINGTKITYYQKTAIDNAISSNYYEMAKMLIFHGADIQYYLNKSNSDPCRGIKYLVKCWDYKILEKLMNICLALYQLNLPVLVILNIFEYTLEPLEVKYIPKFDELWNLAARIKQIRRH